MRIVAAHHNADLDALACLVAAARLYDAVPVGGSSISPPVQRFLALHKDRFPLVAPGDVETTDVEQVILVDVRDSRRVRDVQHLLDAADRVIVWDHHPPTEHDVEADEEHVEPMGACITLLVEELQEAGLVISTDEATLFLLGLYADTGRLSYGTVRPRDVAVAEFLLRRSANLRVVNRYLRHTLTTQQSGLLVELLGTVREISIDQVELAIATATTGEVVRGAAEAVQHAMELGGHDALFGVLHFARNDRVQVIGRSRISYVDVGAILHELGGGGHRGAGAASLKGVKLDEVERRLEEILRRVELEPLRVRDIMSAPIRFLPHDTSLQEAKAALASWAISGAPVQRGDDVVGVLSKRDIARAERAGSLHLPVSSHMAHEVMTVDEGEPIEEVLEMMTAADVGRMPVTRDEELVGIVTRTDLLRQLYMTYRDDSDLEL